MTTLNEENFADLKIDLDIAQVWNDIRVLLPSYSYTLELQGSTWIKIPDDYSQRYVEGASVNKYGRRTRTLNKHVIDRSFGEEYCHSEADKSCEPLNRLDIKLVGKDPENIAICLLLAASLSSQVSYMHEAIGLDNTGMIEKVDLDIDLDRIPRLNMTMSEIQPQISDWLIVDSGHVDGEIIG